MVPRQPTNQPTNRQTGGTQSTDEQTSAGFGKQQKTQKVPFEAFTWEKNKAAHSCVTAKLCVFCDSQEVRSQNPPGGAVLIMSHVVDDLSLEACGSVSALVINALAAWLPCGVFWQRPSERAQSHPTCLSIPQEPQVSSGHGALPCRLNGC